MNLQVVPIDQIRPNPVSLRSLQSNTASFAGLVESIRQKGFLGAITVRQKDIPRLDQFGNPSGEVEMVYELVDGLQRYSAAKIAGMEEIPVNIMDMNDADVLEGQLMANFHRVTTTPSQYSQQLRRMLDLNPTMTEAELAQKLGVSSQFIQQRLELVNIRNPRIQDLVDNGDIKLGVAYALAKLPEEEQEQWIDRCITEDAKVIIPALGERLNQIKEDRRAGRTSETQAEFVPVAHLRKLTELKKAVEDVEMAESILAEYDGSNDPANLVLLGIQYALHLDPVSLKAAKAKFDQDAEAKKASKAKREAERAARQVEALKLKQEQAKKKQEEAMASLSEDAREELKAIEEAKSAETNGHTPIEE